MRRCYIRGFSNHNPERNTKSFVLEKENGVATTMPERDLSSGNQNQSSGPSSNGDRLRPPLSNTLISPISTRPSDNFAACLVELEGVLREIGQLTDSNLLESELPRLRDVKREDTAGIGCLLFDSLIKPGSALALLKPSETLNQEAILGSQFLAVVVSHLSHSAQVTSYVRRLNLSRHQTEKTSTHVLIYPETERLSAETRSGVKTFLENILETNAPSLKWSAIRILYGYSIAKPHGPDSGASATSFILRFLNPIQRAGVEANSDLCAYTFVSIANFRVRGSVTDSIQRHIYVRQNRRLSYLPIEADKLEQWAKDSILGGSKLAELCEAWGAADGAVGDREKLAKSVFADDSRESPRRAAFHLALFPATSVLSGKLSDSSVDHISDRLLETVFYLLKERKYEELVTLGCTHAVACPSAAPLWCRQLLGIPDELEHCFKESFPLAMLDLGLLTQGQIRKWISSVSEPQKLKEEYIADKQRAIDLLKLGLAQTDLAETETAIQITISRLSESNQAQIALDTMVASSQPGDSSSLTTEEIQYLRDYWQLSAPALVGRSALGTNGEKVDFLEYKETGMKVRISPQNGRPSTRTVNKDIFTKNIENGVWRLVDGV